MTGGFAVETPTSAKSTSRWWYVLGGTLAAPYVVMYALEQIDDVVTGWIPLGRLPWFTYWLFLLGLVIGGIIIAITASLRFKQRHVGARHA